MSMVGKTFKQKMAAFLAVCMVASAVPTGPVFAAEEPKEESSAASLVEFDVEKLKEAVEKAVKKDDMVAPPVVVASSSVANFDTSSYELSGATNLLKDGTEMPDDTDLRIFLVPDDLGYDADNTYTVTGNESLIFMLENTGKEEQGYQLVFGNKITDVIEVKSKAQLLHEYEMGEEESEAETSKATPSNAESIQEGQIAPENETQAQTPAEDTSGQDVQNSGQEAASQESTSADSIQEGQVAPENETTAAETEAAAEESQAAKEKTEAQTSQETKAAEEETAAEEKAAEPETEAEAVQEDETEAEVEEKEPIVISNPEEEDEEEAASQVTIGKIFDVLTGSIVAYGAEPETTATPSDASEEDKPAADVPETSEPVKETPETTAPAESVTEETTEAETETAAETTAAPEETTSAPAEEATVPAQATEEASPSNATEAEETVDRTFESAAGGYVKLNAEISASTLIMRKDSFEKEEVTGILKPMARMVSLFAGEDAEDDTKVTASSTRAVAFVTAAYGDVMALAETSGADIKVNLYDYSGTGQSNAAINNYLQTEGLDIRFNNPSGPAYNYYQNYNGTTGKINIYQGIPGEEGETNLLTTLFPDARPANVSTGTLQVYPGVNPAFIQYDEATGTYSYDSSETYAYYDAGTNTLSQSGAGDGFWPFNTSDEIRQLQGNDFRTGDNWFFGMSMSFDLYRPSDGQFQGEDMTFYFSGDDDVWVYLVDETGNEKLVLDLGGNHGRMDGWINFADGTVTYSNENAFARERYYTTGEGSWWSPTEYHPYPVVYNPESGTSCTYVNNGTERVYSRYVTDEFQDFITSGSNFTLKFYYLERGGNASNCKIQFNLPVVPSQGITIQKQLSGKDLEDYRDNDFQFRVISAENEETLVAYQNSGGNDSNGEVVVDEITVNGLTSATADVEAGYYFYIEEIDTGNASVSWEVTTSDGSQGGATEGTKSGIYKAPDDETQLGFLFLCTNQYGELTPSVAKTAYRVGSIENAGVYDVTIQVEGSEITEMTGGGSAEPIDLVVVMDRSLSLNSDTYRRMKETVAEIFGGEDGLPEGSYISAVAFSNIGSFNRDTREDRSYENYGTNYYDVTVDWMAAQSFNSRSFMDQNRTEAGTHSAAGFRGAINQLANRQGSTNKKVVIYMTDGVPMGGVYSTTDRWGRQVWRYTTDETRSKNAAIEQLRALAETGAEIYTVGYSGSFGEDWDWLRPVAGYGVTNFYESSSIDELKAALIEISEAIPSTTKVKNPIVTDKLGAFADIYATEQVDGQTVPILYYNNTDASSIEWTENDGVTNAGTKLTASISSTSANVVNYHLEDTLIAEYNLNSETITWYVNGQGEGNLLGDNEYRSLTFQVVATGDYRENIDDTTAYPDPADLGTGTHGVSDENYSNRGYYSNDSDNAYLSYENAPDGENVPLPRPVIRPVQNYTTLTLEKNVEAEGFTPDSSWEFEFEVRFNQPLKDGGDYEETDIAGKTWYVYTVTLEDNGEYEFTGVPVGAEYQIEESEWVNNDYKVTDVEYSISPSTAETVTNGVVNGTVPTEEVTVTCTNTIEPYHFITISKVVDGNKGEDDDYEFTVFYQESSSSANPAKYPVSWSEETGTYVYDRDGEDVITLSKDESAIIRLEPGDVDKMFFVEETDSKNAWQVTYQLDNNEASESVPSFTGEESHNVVVTNHYYEHSIRLTKEVDGKELYTDATYSFAVRFTTVGNQPLSKDDIAVSDGDGTDRDFTLTNNVLTVELKAGETVLISGLPQIVQSYVVTETLPQLPQNADYEVALKDISVSQNVTKNPEELTASGNFNSKQSQNDEITYINEYRYLYGSLEIDKELTDGVKADGDTVFTFKITNQDTGEVFYAAVTVENGKRNGSVRLTQIPIGTYTVEEIDSTVRYELSSAGSVTVIVTEDDGGQAEFTNTKTGDSYFHNVSAVVNKVDNGEFVSVPGNVTPIPESILQTATALEMNAGAYLLPDQLKKQSGEDDVIQPA